MFVILLTLALLLCAAATAAAAETPAPEGGKASVPVAVPKEDAADRTEESSGSLGDAIRYVLRSDGRLEITGEGDMKKTSSRSPFGGSDKIRSVVIGEGVTSICEEAFFCCTELTEVTFPDSLTAIGANAFANCISLRTVPQPKNVRTVGEDAFANTPWFDALPDGPVYFGDLFLRYKGAAPKDTALVIKNGTAGLADAALRNCRNITSVTVPDGVTEIVYFCFSGCADLREIHLPDSVTAIGTYAFTGCEALQEFRRLPNLTEIGGSAFARCAALRAFPFNEGLQMIGGYAFSGCGSLTEADLPDSLTTLGSGAYAECASLRRVTIGKGLPDIESYSFLNCASLEEVSVPGNIKMIGASAFEGCVKLRNITLEEGVQTIRTSAFNDCAALEEFLCPDSLTSLSNYVFMGCSSLRRVRFGKDLEAFSRGTFTNCAALEILECSTANPYFRAAGNCVIRRTDASVVLGCKGSIIPADGSVKAVSPNAFQGTRGLTKIDIPNDVKSIGKFAFSECSDLAEITLPDSITEIVYASFGATAVKQIDIPVTVKSLSGFNDCKKLEAAPIPDGVEEIVDYAFTYCVSLKEARFPQGLKTVGDRAYYGCDSLTEIHIPAGVASIGPGAFSHCAALRQLTVDGGNQAYYAENGCLIERESGTLVSAVNGFAFPTDGSLKAIGSYACAGLSSLTEVTLPESVTAIGGWAFKDCENLRLITIPPEVTSIASSWQAPFPGSIVICGRIGSYAHRWAQQNGYAFVPNDKLYLTMAGPDTVNEPAVPLSGYATPGAEIVFSVNGEEALRISSGAGAWQTTLPLTGLQDGENAEIDARIKGNDTAAGKTAGVGSRATVAFRAKAVVLKELTMTHRYSSATVTTDKLAAAQPAFTFVPGTPFSFRISVSNSDRVKELFIVSTKEGMKKQLPLVWNEPSGCWFGTGFFDEADHSYVPGDLTVEGTDLDGQRFVACPAVSFLFLIDPSGYAYEAVRSNRLEGATATVWYRTPDGLEMPWDAARAGQQNPVVTAADGAFAWDVPEGVWQIRLKKNGYSSAMSEWMEVPPERTDVFIPMESTDSPSVSSLNVYKDHAVVLFNTYMEIDSVTPSTVRFEGYDCTVDPIDKTESIPGSGIFYAKAFRFTPAVPFKGEVEVNFRSIRFLTPDGEEKLISAQSYLGAPLSQSTFTMTGAVSAEPAGLTADKTLRTAAWDRAALTVSAENATGKTVSVSCDSANVTLSARTLTLDEKGKATLTVTGEMPGTATLTFTLNGTALTARTEVTVTLPERPTVTAGDVDGDGEITSGDARLALRASVKLEDYADGSEQFLAADVDRNGTIESSDARLILRASVKLEDPALW